MLLAVITTALLSSTRTEVHLARNIYDAARARAAAEAGVSLAIKALVDDDIGLRRWDGRPRVAMFGPARLTTSIQDEAGKIDINVAEGEILRRLFDMAGIQPDRARTVAQSIVDWRDKDDARQPNGAEIDNYHAAGMVYGPRNGPFETLNELRLVLGVRADILRVAGRYLTVTTGSKQVDPVTAPVEVLLALPGVTYEQAAAIVGARESIDGGTAAETRLRLPPLASTTAPYLGQSRRDAYTVEVRADTDTGAIFVRRALVTIDRRNDPPFWLVSWEQGEVSFFELLPVSKSRTEMGN